MSTSTHHAADHGHEHHPTGWRRFVYSTNHKDIGTMYLIFAVVAGLIGGLFSVIMRAELQTPGAQLLLDSSGGAPAACKLLLAAACDLERCSAASPSASITQSAAARRVRGCG